MPTRELRIVGRAGAWRASLLRCRGQIVLLGVVIAESVLDTPGAGGTDSLVNGECLLQMGGSFADVVVVEVASADSLERACFLERRAEVPGYGQCLAVMVAGLLTLRRSGHELAEAVQRFGLAVEIGRAHV